MTGWFCNPVAVTTSGAAQPGTPVLTSDKTGASTQQPASYCGVVLSPPTAATGFAFLQRTGADEVTYNVSLAGWSSGNTLHSVQIQPGGPGVAYPDNLNGGPVVELGRNAARNYTGPGSYVVRSGTFGSANLFGLLANKSVDTFFDLLVGRTTYNINGITVPLQGAYAVIRSDSHPVAGELRGQLSPAVFKLSSGSSSS
ncbi:hypothetical protein WJX81_001272 [Elliptochloris bilobata]|uniref:Uncharacterized protein n=1 Tax=Elliptochloris bilobata TaxID=381761 RepID=A0AAW1SKB2_9CHLO